MDTLITVFGLFVAMYAIVPRDRQLDLRLQISFLDKTILTFGCLAIFYIQFYRYFVLHGLALFVQPWFPRKILAGINPQNAIYLVILSMIAWLAFHMRFSRLSTSNISKFRDLAEELFWADSYSELFALLQKHYKQLFNIYHSRFFMVRLKNFLDPESLSNLMGTHFRIRDNDASAIKSRFDYLRNLRTWLRSAISHALPTSDRATRTAEDIVRTILLSPRVVNAMARSRPYLGLDVIHEWSGGRDVEDFVELYITELLKNPESVLFAEIENNQNLSKHDRYVLNPSNRLVSFFLTDANIAHDLNLYRPLGEYAISFLNQLARAPSEDSYCLSMDDFKDVGKWHSPLFAVIRFFDIMVSEALYQGIEWHMWLYYMPHIAERCVSNYRLDDKRIDPDDEWPNRYSYILYEVVSKMRGWIRSVEWIDSTQPNVVLKTLRADHENGNIPKSAILALCEVTRGILVAQTISDRFKACIMDIVFELYFDLRSIKHLNGYAEVLKAAILQGGVYSRKTDDVYRVALNLAFQRGRREYMIKHNHEFVTDLEAAITP